MRKKIKRIPKAIVRRIGYIIDYCNYHAQAKSYWKLAATHHYQKSRPTLMIVAGRGMNVSNIQMWLLLALAVRVRGYNGMAFTWRSQHLLNRYFRLFKIELVYLDDNPFALELPTAIATEVRNANSLETYRAITYRGAPVGEIGLSTYSRHLGTGVIDYANPEVNRFVSEWIARICSNMHFAETVFKKYNVTMLFFSEVFMEEYGAIYYEALLKELSVIRFAGTVRDNAIIIQSLSKANDRMHHSSIDKTTWDAIKHSSDDIKLTAELMQNFDDRYGNKWHRSQRNHRDTQQLTVDSARQQLGVAPERKVAVIYSHILYDTLFFFGTDLFKDYAEWLVETVRAAIANPHIDWLVKVHPSNIWRGELNTLLKGRYEEERLLQNAFGTLPPHVRIIGAETKISPLTWFQLADYGITVRGTSGLEMAALGKTVITAGTGRYEGNGFTIDPKDASEYLTMLSRLPELTSPTSEQIRLAKIYAHAIFVRKPYTLSCVAPKKRWGCKTVYASDDILYAPVPFTGDQLPDDLTHFSAWALQPRGRDLLNDI